MLVIMVVALGAAVLAARKAFRRKYFATIATKETPYHIFLEICKKCKFAQNLEDQHVEVVRVDWKPPAGGDQEMIDLLGQLL